MVRLQRREMVESASVTRWHVHYLLTGQRYIVDFSEFTDDDVRQLWDMVQPHIEEQLIEALPGWRCWSWWRFEATEPRRQAAGVPITLGDCPLTFGEPTRYRPRKRDTDFESVHEYLTRFNLWIPGERDAAARWAADIEQEAHSQFEARDRGTTTLDLCRAQCGLKSYRERVTCVTELFPDE